MEGRRIYLMRHGETLYQSRSTEGAIGNGALTERGREQVAAAALLFRGVPLDGVYASPLSRACETAEIIAAPKGIEVTLCADLREITPSDDLLAGKTTAAIFRQVQQFFKSPTTGWDDSYLGGESFRQVQERGVRFVRDLLRRDDWQTVLLVAHGGFNNALIAYATGVTSGRVFNVEQDFGCINIIDFVHDCPLLRLANFTLYDQLKINLRAHSLDIILSLLHERGIIQ
jgi:broad specificity phosphatase PhoE